jgi:hypothetical protein
MCQFLSLPLFKIPEISKFDVIMRLDSDSFIHGAAPFALVMAARALFIDTVPDGVRRDPFEEFVTRQCSYGYLAVGLEHPRMLRGLYDAISEFMGRSSQRLQSWFQRRFLDKDGGYNGDFFYNNFEM